MKKERTASLDRRRSPHDPTPRPCRFLYDRPPLRRERSTGYRGDKDDTRLRFVPEDIGSQAYLDEALAMVTARPFPNPRSSPT
jgi:hypothetical protein